MHIIADDLISTGESVLTLGMFDGVHLGHRVLIQKGRALATQLGAPLVTGTFTTHPMALIAPESCPPMLTTLDEREKIMEGLGVDILYAQPFTDKTMHTAPERYIAALCTRFHPRHIVAGFDFTFGEKGEGNAMLLTALGKVFGYTAHIVPKITYEGREVSSTAIRAAIGRGDLREARLLLGRPYQRELVTTGDEYRWQGNGKIDVPAGVYRAIALSGEKRLPVTTRVTDTQDVSLFPALGDVQALQFLGRAGKNRS